MTRPAPDCVNQLRRGRFRRIESFEDRKRAVQRLELLRRLEFGSQVAEEEVRELQHYFVQTHQWDQIASGRLDIIRGDKGAGKSAIYSLLSVKEDDFFDRRILLVAAERPQGTTVFKDLTLDPPTTEREFVSLWKLYIVTLIARTLKEYQISGGAANKLYGALEAAKLLERDTDLAGVLRGVQQFARRLLGAEGQIGIELDPATMMPSGYVAKLGLKEPTHDLRAEGFNSLDNLFTYANSALTEHRYSVWILLDRLDVAFLEHHELEANALRALIRVYADLRAFDHISLKIFLREDIWKRIFESGFREASHLIKVDILKWSAETLLNLVIRRLLNNQILLDEYHLDRNAILQDSEEQEKLFYRLFPAQVEQGIRKSPTFKWLVSRCADASGHTAPRELIHLLKSIQQNEIRRLENGGTAAADSPLFDPSVFKAALEPVSTTRLNTYLYAEYPDYKPYLELLRREKTEQTIGSLAQIWGIEDSLAAQRAEKLREIGFFERRGSREKPAYWVPFLYRDALDMVQGRAEQEGHSGNNEDDDEG